ncbi:expressed unknown protein [Seminavis robusta]|uniref:WW domain-containing protein n=1 Tax=Seminavis robusta TaxID=568900 RepID=A0A9N8HMT9_9STRA|nr:expressed unknown protein [Seminavis robusta]|eukprot:Sro771_g200130.1 n/a (295) ;mRNA; r:8392-9276
MTFIHQQQSSTTARAMLCNHHKAPLPPGWQRLLSKSQQRFYYSHAGAQHSQWRFPTPAEAANPWWAKKRANSLLRNSARISSKRSKERGKRRSSKPNLGLQNRAAQLRECSNKNWAQFFVQNCGILPRDAVVYEGKLIENGMFPEEAVVENLPLLVTTAEMRLGDMLKLGKAFAQKQANGIVADSKLTGANKRLSTIPELCADSSTENMDNDGGSKTERENKTLSSESDFHDILASIENIRRKDIPEAVRDADRTLELLNAICSTNKLGKDIPETVVFLNDAVVHDGEGLFSEN